MGSPVGVFDDSELEGLTQEDKALLKRHVLHHIQTDPDILSFINDNPHLLTDNSDIRNILRGKAGGLQRRLKRGS